MTLVPTQSEPQADTNYSITFDGNDSCCPKACYIPTPISVFAGQCITLPGIIPERQGYCFLLWNTSYCGKGDSYLPGETIFTLDKNLYLYAIWQRNSCCCTCPPPVTGAFTLKKNDSANNAGLGGAVFSLSMNGQIVRDAISDASGSLTFNGLKPGTYELTETTPPTGYQRNPTPRQVVVDVHGNVTIDGVPANNTIIYNTPLSTAHLSFTKTDASTGLPLAGAAFELSNGSMVVSKANGAVDFGPLPAGTYTLKETSSPDGYTADQSIYTVVVSDDGNITIDGKPLSQFHPENAPRRSDRPVILSITEGDRVVTGTGIPGALITVEFPDGTTAEATVGSDGQWFVVVPSTTNLQANQTVYANQTAPGLGTSENASFLIQAHS